MSAPRPTRVPTASAVLAAEIRSRIIRERLPDGTPIQSETELIASSGLSRATVREAIRLLASEGIITTHRGPGGGIRVSSPDLHLSTRSIAMILARSEASLRELFDLRILLEVRAAELCALAADEQQLTAIADAVDTQGSRLPDMMGFHRLVALGSGNDFFAVMLEIVHSLAEWHTPGEGLDAHALGLGGRAHHKIVRSLRARDAEGAGQAMRVHLEAFRDGLAAAGRLDAPVIRAGDWDPRA
ncbi:MAG TPA: FCD domain-containing protein [Protaetiibacter sp.]|nr:FCD domain-containing protein [Protaetiibacter sp.]